MCKGRVLLFGGALMVLSVAAAEKKLIELGWDIPTTAYMKAHWAEMDRESPFDGVMFSVALDDEGKKYDSQWGFDNTPWRRTAFTNAITDLKACSFKRLTHNFIRLNFSPGSVAWSDDAGWKVLCEKAAVLAWVAKAGGAKGLAPDFESYGEHLFRYKPGGPLGFAETAALARRRGAAFMTAMAGEFPDAVLLPLWLNSINHKAGAGIDPDGILATEEYGLLPAFINGMLDTLPPAMTLVDGCENGYYLDGSQAYLAVARDMKSWYGPAARLVAPENRVKYRAQVQAGFGFYLDMYLNEKGNNYYFGPKEGGTRLDRLSDNLTAALAACDEYVWVYGEQCRWWTSAKLGGSVEKSVGKGTLWDEALPGVARVIGRVRDPVAAARAEVETLKQKNSATNLVRNGDFATPDQKQLWPAEWSVWQDEGSKGVFSHDAQTNGGAAKAVKVARGCLLQKYPAKVGELFYVAARCKSLGASAPTVMLRWQRADGTWVRWDADVTLAFAPGESGAWRACSGVAVVPSEAEQLVILLNVHQQTTDTDICWLDDVEVFCLGTPGK